jgi:hypothetical protein
MYILLVFTEYMRDRRGRDRMVVGFTFITTCTCAISDYHHLSCEFELRSW